MALPLRVDLSVDRVDAAPGDAVSVDVTVRNTSDIVEHYDVEVLGLPAGATASAQPDIAKLRPGETATTTVRMAIGADSPAAAGLYTLGILVHSRYRTEVSRCEELPLVLAAVEDIAVRVEPEVATGGRSAQYTVQVTNGGNLPVRLGLAAADPERRVTAAFEPPIVDVPQGTTGYTYLTVSAPVPWNKEKQRVLTVEATGPGVRGAATATFVQRPRIASRLLRVGGMLGAVLLIAGAVVGGALIARGGDEPAQRAGAASEPPAAGASAPVAPPAASAASEQAQPSPTAPATTEGATSAAPPPPEPRAVDLTRPFGEPANGVLPSDAFRDDGLILAGAPAQNGPQECAEATAVAVSGDGTRGRSLSAALPDGGTDCSFVPVQIRLLSAVTAVEVVVAGNARREMEVVYRDLSRTIENDLRVTDDGSRGGIDFILVRGVPDDPGGQPPATQLRAVRFTPAQ
jgi:hypothetical protein